MTRCGTLQKRSVELFSEAAVDASTSPVSIQRISRRFLSYRHSLLAEASGDAMAIELVSRNVAWAVGDTIDRSCREPPAGSFW